MSRAVNLALLAAALAAFSSAARAQDDDGSAVDRDGETGREIYEYWCLPCHGEGPGHPGTAALEALYGDAKPAVLTEREDLVPALTRQFVRNGVSVMPFFRRTEISEEELDALAAYLAP